MSWIQENKFTAVVAGGALAGSIALGVLAMGQSDDYKSANAKLKKTLRKEADLRSIQPYPNEENLAEKTDIVDAYEKQSIELRKQFDAYKPSADVVKDFAPDAFSKLVSTYRAQLDAKPVKDLLADSGISFPDGATASFSKARSVLTVRNTSNALDLVEALVDEIKSQTPQQIRMSTKFVEVTQENTDELSFDWLLTPTPLNGAGSVFLGGGTVGNGAPRNSTDFINPVNGFNIPGIPTDSTTANVSNISTAGNRSGGYAVTRDSIDAFLNNPNRTANTASVAPGIMSFTGLFTDGQVQMIMRGLSQKKGADVMTAPSIVARSGEKATIEIIREFIYPTEYEPPELPTQVGSSGSDDSGAVSNVFPVTPATPTAFETRNTGVTLEVEPTLGEDGYTIDLSFAPEIVDFEGFVNYGSPIQTTSSDALGNPVIITITENRIEMPVFSTRRVTTGLTIYDGHTVAVGGLMREDVQNVEDKVPILGDLPLVGRLFQSKAENHVKSNLIVFVSVNIIDATGKSVRNPMGELDTEEEAGGDLLPPI
ncbi:Amuc_1100 family pilus-like protein [Rubritalea marina]|uniref:Amuc_1100 family pilus-like protein n=1 Tax=Rubritalea marina TaxID=361055 RepID=UPI00037C6F87|nr:Amuc_1100 family pilus-like protein [Rubritalea marina]